MARNKRPKTVEEIRKQKRECERKRRARIKANPDLYEATGFIQVGVSLNNKREKITCVIQKNDAKNR